MTGQQIHRYEKLMKSIDIRPWVRVTKPTSLIEKIANLQKLEDLLYAKYLRTVAMEQENGVVPD